MTPDTKSSAGLPGYAEARDIIDRARRMRAETLAGLARAAWSRIARQPAGAPGRVPAPRPAGAMPHAHA